MKKQKAFAFVPSVNHLLIRQNPAIAITKGGIHVPDEAKQRPMEGVVVALGLYESNRNSVGQDKYPYKIGETVLFGKYDGIEIRLDEEDFLLLEYEQILGTRLQS